MSGAGSDVWEATNQSRRGAQEGVLKGTGAQNRASQADGEIK